MNKAYIFVASYGYFVFDIDGTVTHTLESDITDHYLEDNTFMQDHWALKPEKVVLKNYQGEYLFTSPLTSPPVQPLTFTPQQLYIQASSKIPSILIPVPKLPQMLQNKNKIQSSVLATMSRPIQRIPLPQGLRQASVYNFFKNLRQARTLITVNTAYGNLTNMAIDNLVPFQDEDTQTLSEFTITLKQIHFVDVITVPFNGAVYNTNNGIQQQSNVNSRLQGQQVGGLPKLPTTTINNNNNSSKQYYKNNFQN